MPGSANGDENDLSCPSSADSSFEDSRSMSLRGIEHDLTVVEQGLARRGIGRAVFHSMGSMLSSLQSRLSASACSNEARLSERLRTAQFSHSNRIPLNVLRQQQQLQQQQQQEDEDEPHGTLRMCAPTKESDDEDDSRRRRLSRSSSLVASRRRAESVETSIQSLHAAGGVALAGSTSTLSPLRESRDGKDCDDDDIIVDDHNVSERETPPLLSRASFKSLSTSSRRSMMTDALEKESAAAVYSWGSGPHSLHDDSEVKPVAAESRVSSGDRVGRLLEISCVACGPHHSALVTKAGAVYACGDNTTGAVDPERKDTPLMVRPVLIESLGIAIVHQVSCGWDHTAALTSTGAVLTWGANEQGQLGHYNKDVLKSFCRPKIMSLGPGTRASSVACGNQFTMVLTTRLSVMVCGTLSGQEQLPRQLPALIGVPISSIAAGKDHAVVVTVFGLAYSWGSNVDGCCGRPFPKALSFPVPMVTPKSSQVVETALGPIQVPPFVNDGTSVVHIADDAAVVHAACGDRHTVLVTRSGRLFVCGANEVGQLGTAATPIVDHLHDLHHPNEDRKFVFADAGKIGALLLDDAGDVWQTLHGSLVPVLTDQHVLSIAAGGDNKVALAGAGRQRKASVDMTNLPVTLECLIQQISSEDVAAATISPTGQELVDRLEELLKHPAVLNSLFLDLTDLDHLYQELAAIKSPKLQQALAAATERSILAGLETMQTAQLKNPSSVRCMLHYIRFFDRKEDSSFDARGTCISALCEKILDLPFEGFKNLLGWTGLYSPELFVRMLVDPLICQLNRSLRVQVDADGVQHQQLSKRAAPSIVGVLHWLYVSSERAGLVTPESYYCDAVSTIPIESLYEDLTSAKVNNQKRERHGVLLSEHPFLIPPTTKREMLLIESQVAMVKTAMQEAAQAQTSAVYTDGNVVVNPFYVLEVDREHLLKDTLKAIKEADPKNLRKKLRIKFKGEDGVDAGGVAKEFFQLLSEDLFDINSGLWTRRFGEDVTWFNSDCTWDDEGFELVGVLVGLALYNGVLLDVNFPQAVYRKLLDKPLGLEDIFDKELRNGLQHLLDYEGNGVEDIFCLTFEVTWMDLGKEQKVELKPNGSNIEVTRDNKEEYVLLYVKWLLVESIQPQWEAFQTGVERIMQGSSLRSLFSPEELELLVVGSRELDFQALQKNAIYEGGYDEKSAAVKNLWKFVINADQETQLNFLKFTTGSSKAPIGGLGAMAFKVQRAGPDSPQLPTSHTCFNTLLLPDYGDDYDKLGERLGRAVLEYEGFGLE